MKWTDQQILRMYRLGLIGLAVLLVLTLAWRDTAPLGRLRIGHLFAKESAFVSQVVPVQRTSQSKAGTTITSEPVYLTMRYPRPFQSAEITVEYENPDNLPIEIGPQTQPSETYDLTGVNHPGLNALMQTQGWGQAAQQGSKALWQRQPVLSSYSDVTQLWQQLPDQERTAYYGADWEKPYLPDFDRRQQPDQQLIPVPVQGPHLFYAATDRDALAVSADVFDLNKRQGPDEVLVQFLDWDGRVLAQQRLDDDGNDGEDGRLSSSRALHLVHTGLPQADVYQISIKTTDDIILKGISIQAPYAVAKGQLRVAGGPEYRTAFGEDVIGPVHLVTNARRLVANTNHIESRQSLYIGQEALQVQEPFVFHEYSMPDTRRFLLSQGYVVTLERGNVFLSGRGVFALSASAYFSPTPWYFDQSIDADVLELSTVLMDYRPPVELSPGLYRQTFSIDLTEAYAPDKSVRLQIALPDMEAGQSMTLRKLESNFHSEPITLSNFTQKLGNFVKREILK